jgi:DNA-binding transcriptional MerR regulator/GGDEF domain-containing protein
MSWQTISDKIHEHLRNTTTRKRLSERFTSARDQLTTTIGEAAKLANISPEKARYAEMIGILSPGRSRESKGDENKGSPHRRYSLGELNRLIVMGDLIEHGFSMTDIAHFLSRERSSTDIMLDSIQAPDLAARLRKAESAYLQRMLIPRLLYFAQCLLLGDVVDCSIALILPVAEDASQARPRFSVTHADDLPLAGPSLVGWHSRSHPYCVLYMREPRMDDATRYELRSVDELCQEAGVADAQGHPTGAYLLIEPEFARLLYAATTVRARADAEAQSADAERDKLPNPRAVAYRLLRYLQAPPDETVGAGDEDEYVAGHRYASFGEGMVYSSPEFMSDMTGDRLLTQITELVIRLGNAESATTSSRRGRWIFSAILTPDNLYLPPGQQSLVVTAQSKMSPHTVGVTRFTPGKNEGLSTLAALSGHMLLRRAIESTDAAVADAGFEDEPGPALALPVLGSYGRALAVLYIRSKYDKNTSTHQTFADDDQMLLRVIVSGYRGNYLARDVLAEMIKQPRSVDRFFQEFKSANAFWVDLETALRGASSAKETRKSTSTSTSTSASRATHPITLIAIDIDGHSNIFNEYGNNTARNLLRAVGRRIASQPLLTGGALMSTGASERVRKNLYHLYGDRFCLLLENFSREDAELYAANLREMLSGDYTLEISRATGSQAAPVTKFKIHEVSVRLALISYDSESLRRLLGPVVAGGRPIAGLVDEPVQYVISLIMNALDAGLNQGKQVGLGAIMYLDTTRGLFRQLPVEADEDRPPTSGERRSAGRPTNGVSSARNYRGANEYRR